MKIDREELRAFLKARRQRLRPESVGLPVTSQRRARGLTRDEVAELAGVSTGWYAQFELGRPINISPKALEGIAQAIKLDRYETQYLFALAGTAKPAEDITRTDVVPSDLRYIVDNYASSPAQVLSRRFDVLHMNRIGRMLFNHTGGEKNDRYNMIFRLFMDPARRRLYSRWEDFARAMTAAFRHNYASAVGDPWFEDLIARLHAESPEFSRFWSEYRVAPAIRQQLELNLGEQRSAYIVWSVFPVPESNGLQLAFTVPADERSEAVFKAYLSD